jgi:hypothetical protein
MKSRKKTPSNSIPTLTVPVVKRANPYQPLPSLKFPNQTGKVNLQNTGRNGKLN